MLSDVVKEFSCRNKDLRVQKVYSVTNSDGFMPSQDYFSKDVFSKDLSNYNTAVPYIFEIVIFVLLFELALIVFLNYPFPVFPFR